MAELVVKPYAKALFDAGLELNKLNEFSQDMQFVDTIFKSEDGLIQILGHPHINRNEKKALIKTIFGNNISEQGINFLYILIDKRREKSLFQIIHEFEELYDDYSGILRVIAVTAIAMEEKSLIKLRSVLKIKTNKKIILTNEVDTSILGGVLLKLENKFIDSTILSQLKSMESYIKAV